MIRAALAVTAAIASGAGAAWLAAHHPLSPPLALAAVAALAAITAARPGHWPLWLLPLLPWIGLMPWTGWLTVEEFDIAVLAVAAAGYARLATGWARPVAGARRAGERLLPTLLWLLPLVASTLIGVARGVADAGGLSWGWWQGYREPLNSLRLAKPLAEVLLLLPLWQATCRVDEAVAVRHLRTAMLLLLAGVALAVVRERAAFTGLMDFSTDYRATGPFWEMHIGGAALDAVLALSIPFALAALADARSPARWTAGAAVLGLALYAALATFSRIVYGTVPLGVLVFWALRAGVGRARGRPPSGAVPALVGLALFALLADAGFGASGYRGLLALVGATVLLLPLPPLARRLSARQAVAAIGAGLLAALLVVALSLGVAKGAYAAYALAWTAGAAALARGRARAALAAFVATLAALLAVGLNWGGADALAPGVAAALSLGALAVAATLRTRPLWPAARGDWRWQGQFAAALVALAALVGVFGGGAYMGSRMVSTAADGQGRLDHWRRALDLLRPTDWVLGKGLGRYWANQVFSGRAEDQTGDYRLLDGGAGGSAHAVVLTSGRHDLGWSEALRLSQRVAVPAPGPVTLRLDLRIDQPVKLQLELNEKHLLYGAAGFGAEHVVEARPGVWQAVEVKIDKGESVTGGPFWAPRDVVFSIALGRHLNRAEMDNLRLIDSQGRDLLVNGDFEHGLAHWFFTSDRYHLPFHAKNMALHLLFEQGLLGLAAVLLATGAALWRTSAGAARGHPLAPALAAALLSLWVVGLVDSIFDMPRVAWLTLWLTAAALTLPARPTRD